MAVEQILGLVTFIVIVLTLSLLLPTKSRDGYRTGGDGGAGAGSAGCFADGGDGGGDGGGD
jgi:hypothetical protein